MDFAPHKGALAYCSRGELGLITSDEPLRVTHGHAPMIPAEVSCDCGPHGMAHGPLCAITRWQEANPAPTGIAWVGIHLSPEKMGQPWSSRVPVVVGEIRPMLFEQGYVVDGCAFSRVILSR